MPKILFVLGNYRSGTTLATRLLNTFPGVFISKETSFLRDIGSKALKEVLSGAASRASRERTWREIHVHLAGEQWSMRPSQEGFAAFLGNLERKFEPGIESFMRYIWQLESPEPYEYLQIIGDNTPAYVAEPTFLAEYFPEAIFLHIVRDPRDVAASVIPLHFGANNAYSAAREWTSRVNCWKQLTRIVGTERCREIRYEDLVVDTEAAFHEVIKFLDIPLDTIDNMLTNQIPVSAKEVSTLSHHTNLSKPMSLEFIGRYKNRLSPRQIQIIEYICASMMRDYGYKPENQVPRLPFPYCEPPMRLSYAVMNRCYMIERRLKKKSLCR